MKVNALLFTLFFTLLTTSIAEAQRRGGGGRGVSLSGSHSFGFGFGFTNADQDDMNDVIDGANSGGGTVKNLDSGYEFFAQYAIRFDKSWWGFVFRPSYISQETDGTCNTGNNCDYSVSGMAFFPMIRMIPLENDFIKLFFQFGLGYGQMSGEIKQGTGSMKFKGSAFGTIGGLGVDFCFTESHCLTVEGNLRYLPIERNLVSSSSGTFSSGLTGGSSGAEVEFNSLDLATTMSGLQGLVSYTLNF
jgi:hypothetical protein